MTPSNSRCHTFMYDLLLHAFNYIESYKYPHYYKIKVIGSTWPKQNKKARNELIQAERNHFLTKIIKLRNELNQAKQESSFDQNKVRAESTSPLTTKLFTPCIIQSNKEVKICSSCLAFVYYVRPQIILQLLQSYDFANVKLVSFVSRSKINSGSN